VTDRAHPHLVAIAGVHGARRVDNCELSRLLVDSPDVDDAWITRRTGVRTRYFGADGETVETLAKDAATAVVQISGIDPAEIDLVMVSTESSMVQSPPVAPSVALHVGAGRAGAFDIVAACAGFSYALGVAAELIASGSMRTVLVVASEKISANLSWRDPATAAIFGDGAGAAIVTAGERRTVWTMATLSDGENHGLIGSEPLSWETAFESSQWPVLRMDGPSVFRWAITHGPALIGSALQRAGSSLPEIDVFVPHQANQRITQALVKRSGLEHTVVADDIVVSGNTSSASIPIAAAALLDSGAAQPGQKALFLGFGAGMTAAAQVVELPERYRAAAV
jgi:3-oxoacyl-[acyl-carrier-protein] synthase-3